MGFELKGLKDDSIIISKPYEIFLKLFLINSPSKLD